MDLASSTSSAVEIGDAGTTGTRRAKLVAGTMAAVVITALLATTLVDQSRGDVGATQADPLVGAAAIEFRAGERVVTSVAADPLIGPAAIEFRAGERESAIQISAQTDPLVGAAAIEFRAGERESAGQ
jgi:hypothetical protein